MHIYVFRRQRVNVVHSVTLCVVKVITNSRQTRPFIVKTPSQLRVSAQIKIYSDWSQLIIANKASIQTNVYRLKVALPEPKRVAATVI